MDNKQLEEYRDKCHMIIEAIEDECKEAGHVGEMMSVYAVLKGFYRDQHGEGALKDLIQSMEPGPRITFIGDEECKNELCSEALDNVPDPEGVRPSLPYHPYGFIEQEREARSKFE